MCIRDRVQSGEIPSKANALLDFNGPVGVPIGNQLLRKIIHPINLIAIQKFNLLLNLQLDCFKAAGAYGNHLFQRCFQNPDV